MVMAWCPNCQAEGGKGKTHDKFAHLPGGGRFLRALQPVVRRGQEAVPLGGLRSVLSGRQKGEGEGRRRRGGRVGREEEGRGEPPAPTVRGRTVTSYAIDMHHQLGELNETRRVWGEGTRRTQRAFDFDSWYSATVPERKEGGEISRRGQTRS